jgi:hypothetical protein
MALRFVPSLSATSSLEAEAARNIREILHPDIDLQELAAHIYLRSVHNISIECSWLRLRLDWGDNAVIVFEKGITEGIYNPDNAQH